MYLNRPEKTFCILAITGSLFGGQMAIALDTSRELNKLCKQSPIEYGFKASHRLPLPEHSESFFYNDTDCRLKPYAGILSYVHRGVAKDLGLPVVNYFEVVPVNIEIEGGETIISLGQIQEDLSSTGWENLKIPSSSHLYQEFLQSYALPLAKAHALGLGDFHKGNIFSKIIESKRQFVIVDLDGRARIPYLPEKLLPFLNDQDIKTLLEFVQSLRYQKLFEVILKYLNFSNKEKKIFVESLNNYTSSLNDGEQNKLSVFSEEEQNKILLPEPTLIYRDNHAKISIYLDDDEKYWMDIVYSQIMLQLCNSNNFLGEDL